VTMTSDVRRVGCMHIIAAADWKGVQPKVCDVSIRCDD